MKWLITISIFFFSFLFFLWVGRYQQLRRSRITKRLGEIQKNSGNEVDTHNEEKGQGNNNKLTLVSLLGKTFGRISWIKRINDKLQLELKKANILMKPMEFILAINISAIAGALIGIILTRGEIIGVFLGTITWVAPLIWLRGMKSKRKTKLNAQLPDMINMTANSLKAGYSLLQALELMSREMAAPLSEEIQKMLQEIRFGVATEVALVNFNQRIESKDLDLIITAMLIQRQVGGNLAQILESIGSTIRERMRIQGEIKSLTAQGKMSMVIFMILPIGISGILLMTNPDYLMTLFTNPIGWLMVGMAIISQLIGAFLIKKIIDIEV